MSEKAEMSYHRITRLEDPLFVSMHTLMRDVFPPEEVLDDELWREPLQDPGIRVFAAVHQGEVVGATEYRYYADLNVAMTDFTIIGRPGLGIGRFLYRKRQTDLEQLASQTGQTLFGMFAEIYDPYRVTDHAFGEVKPMDPFVRREVLSHIGYRRLDFPYVHPSWENDGTAVTALDLGFLSADEQMDAVQASLVSHFLQRYYAVLLNKPDDWHRMITELEKRQVIPLLPL